MLITGTAKEAKSLHTGDIPKDLHGSEYGATHAGVGFANYVVGNEVAKFWKSETGTPPGALSMRQGMRNVR
eukprot:2345580-Rhodomonas_salina.4